MRPAMRILGREHLALRAVARIIAMEAVLLARGGQVDIALLESIAAYIAEFPNRIHHPKEEAFLFRAMRERAPQRCAALLDRLLSDHGKEDDSIAQFLDALTAYKNSVPGATAQLAEVAGSYARHLERHIEVENTQAFPLAEEVLLASDWQTIDAAFMANDDPLVSATPGLRYADLHRRIMALGATPPGV
ncbi:hemerythrin domain-containing protein [Rhodoferax sp.]|uniref:hemerythrin domain-containing protein n=1 Tax=Rhodoferax sp. TaxID=50421 RepID=UPI0027247AAF|nr:hemerythrin domain-containing protein [Rhodoferax sp.]MDO9198804.1 hemerythrin domain-containing protein [Rhodoferax sp.]